VIPQHEIPADIRQFLRDFNITSRLIAIPEFEPNYLKSFYIWAFIWFLPFAALIVWQSDEIAGMMGMVFPLALNMLIAYGLAWARKRKVILITEDGIVYRYNGGGMGGVEWIRWNKILNFNLTTPLTGQFFGYQNLIITEDRFPSAPFKTKLGGLKNGAEIRKIIEQKIDDMENQ